MKKLSTALSCVLFSGTLLFSGLTLAQTPSQESVAAPLATAEQSAAPKGKKASVDAQVNINQATAEELSEVMLGIGLKKAQSIVNYRDQNGPFSSIEQLQDVPGIGLATVERNLSRLKL
ncbi:ComEA family DNA-binding protein [Leminorella grimontii]|uniref:ComEA family DNA-binding protein n=1 Tax=Leminorella grimontii TaxID=82981 RepID=UPI00321FFADB